MKAPQKAPCSPNFDSCHLCSKTKTSVFQRQEWKQGSTITRKTLNRNVLLYLQKGELIVNYGISKSARLQAGNLFLLPKNLMAECRPVKDAVVTLCFMTFQMDVCHKYSKGMLEKKMREISMGGGG